MSTKASIRGSEQCRLYVQVHLDAKPTNLFLELIRSSAWFFTKETTVGPCG